MALPPDGITPTSYFWTVPSGMRQVSQSGNLAIIQAAAAGIGGALRVSAVYAGTSFVSIASTFISVRPLPAKPIFINPPSILCWQVPTEISIASDPAIDSVNWSLPYGVYPTIFPKSTSNTIHLETINTVPGFIVAQTFYNGCGNKDSKDSIYVQMLSAPAMPLVYRNISGGSADPTCRQDLSLYTKQNPNPTIQYVWEWDASVTPLEFFGENKRAALFDPPGSNFDV